jgi:hypothetical protein
MEIFNHNWTYFLFHFYTFFLPCICPPHERVKSLCLSNNEGKVTSKISFSFSQHQKNNTAFVNFGVHCFNKLYWIKVVYFISTIYWYANISYIYTDKYIFNIHTYDTKKSLTCLMWPYSWLPFKGHIRQVWLYPYLDRLP